MRLVTLSLLVSLVALPPLVEAQDATEIVELVGGSFFRGTIMERVEGSHVIIQTTSGELRRVAIADIAYAGPVEGRTRRADGSPASALDSPVGPSRSTLRRPRAPARTRARDRGRRDIEVEVTARGGRHGLVLHQLTGTATGSITRFGDLASTTVSIDAFRPLCVAPCVADLTRGAYVFGVARDRGRVLPMNGAPLQLDADGHIEMELLDRGGERVVGWLIFLVAGVAGGGALALAPLFLGGASLGSIAGGAAMLTVSFLISLPFILFNDGAEVRFVEARP